MAHVPHKGTELSNVSKTWDKNERERGQQRNEPQDIPAASELDRMVSEEAKDYDNANAEDNLLEGDRASLRDTNSSDSRDR